VSEVFDLLARRDPLRPSGAGPNRSDPQRDVGAAPTIARRPDRRPRWDQSGLSR